MSSASQSNIDRFNKYKSMTDAAASACIRSFLHLVRPTEGFPYHSNRDIERAWWAWKGEEEDFYHMTGSRSPRAERTFPPAPPEDDEHKPCRQMWGCLVQEQVERQDFQGPLIKDAVAAIMASEACLTHPATCACKVPNNPWTWHECVKELEPLGLKHNPKCQCGGYQTCKQTVPAPVPLPAPVAVVRQSTYEYKHNVDSCACGTCHKARVDSGTDDTYMERCRENSKRTLAEMNNRLLRREESFRESCPDCKASARGTCVECHVAMNSYDERHYLKTPSVLEGIRKAYHLEDATLIAKKKVDFAKEIFAAMGTPHDSTCPHGMPFYACMPCSH